ncbi:MAG: ABC transporter ATP-binding protein, partial [Myxococcota bacterium]
LLGSYGATIDAGYALLVYVGAWLWIEGTLQPEVLLLFIVVSLKFFQPLFDLGVSILLLRFGQQALERTEAILGTPILPEPSAPQVPTGAAIQFSEVSFRYQDAERPALDKVNAQMPERSLTAIVGASGSGKSTMVHLIARLWDIEEGSITMGGVDLRDMTTAELHRQITMVFQDVTLFNGTVRENVLIGKPDATDAELEQAARAAQAHDFIMGLPQGYDTPIGGEGARLSGGEKQRLSIARALLKNAPIVLLDEATASIDPAAEIHIQRAIDALVRERTVVVIAHRLRTIARAHHILVLHEGRLVEAGSHHQLLERDDRYAALWKAQARQRDGSETPKGD